jgi:hypothetical protein
MLLPLWGRFLRGSFWRKIADSCHWSNGPQVTSWSLDRAGAQQGIPEKYRFAEPFDCRRTNSVNVRQDLIARGLR